MAKEDRCGRAQYLRGGDTLQTADGKQIIAVSNEVDRLGYLLNKGHSEK